MTGLFKVHKLFFGNDLFDRFVDAQRVQFVTGNGNGVVIRHPCEPPCFGALTSAGERNFTYAVVLTLQMWSAEGNATDFRSSKCACGYTVFTERRQDTEPERRHLAPVRFHWLIRH